MYKYLQGMIHNNCKNAFCVLFIRNNQPSLPFVINEGINNELHSSHYKYLHFCALYVQY